MEFGQSSFYSDFKWFLWIEKIKELKGIPWSDVEELETIDFLNSMSYLKAKGEQQKKEMDEMSRKLHKK